MTDAPPCQTCFHYNLADGMDRCRRHQHMRDGKISTMRPGFLCRFERDSIPEPQREEGDKCGPEGIHWRSML